MNSKWGKKFGAGAIVLLITVCFIPVMAGAFEPGDGRQDKGIHREGHHRPPLGIWRNLQMIQELKLTEEQVKQLREADFTFREKCLKLKAQLDWFHLQMDKAFSDEIIDHAAVLQLAKKISDIKDEMFIQNIESRLAVGKFLNTDQIKKLKLYEMHPKKQGPRHGDKHISGEL